VCKNIDFVEKIGKNLEKIIEKCEEIVKKMTSQP
jgi:hypothetical protein